MIFCALTGTPCVVIRSFDHKVMEGYQWLKEVPMMKLIEQPEPERVTAAVKEPLTKETNRAGFPQDMYFKEARDKISGEAR